MSITHEAPARSRRPEFGLKHRLVRAREEAGLEQYDLAEALDISRGTISNYERGVTHPNRLQLNAWAEACGVDAEWLRGDGVDPRKGRGGRPNPRTSNPMAQVARHHAGRKRPGGGRTDQTHSRGRAA